MRDTNVNKNSDSNYRKLTVSKGRRIFSEGEFGDYAYIIQSGEVGIFKKIEGSEIEIATLHPGEIFGEVAVLDGQERIASAVANQDTTLVVVTPKAMEERIAKSDKFIKTLLQIFMSNLRDTHLTYKDPSHSIDGRIRAIQRHCNAIRDLMQTTHSKEFMEEGAPLIRDIRANCDKLFALAEKYDDKLIK